MSVIKHHVLIVGVGSIGERHLRCFQATQRAELALVEVNETLRQTVTRRYEVPRTYASLQEAMAHHFTAAVIATPAPLHIPMARQLAEAGIHLLIEKPLSTSLDGTEELRHAIAKHRLIAAVAYVYRAHPALAAMHQAIISGRFGNPVQIVAVSGQHFPTYRPAYRQIYYANHETGGGAVQDALTHVLNAAQWLVGPANRLTADAAHQVLEGVEVEDTVHVLTRHGQTLGSFSLNQHQVPNELTITVICDHGTARFEYHNHRWRWMTDPGSQWHDEPAGPLERDTIFINQAHAFLDAVEGKSPPLCSLDEGIQTLRTNLAILKSMEANTWQWP